MRATVKKFASSTGIKAFGFAFNAKTNAERSFWILLILCGTGLTIFDVFSTVGSYVSFPTGTKVTLVNNLTISLGEPTLCVTIQLPSYPQNGNQLMLINSSNSLLSIINGDTINSSYSDLIDLLILLIAETIQVEQGVLGAKLADNGDPTKLLPNFKYKSELLPMVNRHLTTLNISLKEVSRLVAAHICRKIKLKVHFYDYSNEDATYVDVKSEICVPKLMLWFGVTGQNRLEPILCVRLPNSYFKYSSSQDLTTIKWQSELTEGRKVSDTDDLASLDLSGGTVQLQMSENLMWIPVYRGHTVGMYIAGEYEKLNRSTTPCLAKAKSKCLLRCRHDFIRSRCGCSPLFDDRITPERICGSLTNLSEFANGFVPGFNVSNADCLKIKLKFQPDPICEAQCFPHCSYKDFSFYYMQGKTASYAEGTRVALFMDRFSFHTITEIPLMTYKTFLGSLGGSLSLYIGASFIVLIHICVFWLSELPVLMC